MAWLILLFWFAIVYSIISRINDKIKKNEQKRLNKKHGQVINLNDQADGKNDIKEQKNEKINKWYKNNSKYKNHTSRENRYYVNSVRDDILREERELYRD